MLPATAEAQEYLLKSQELVTTLKVIDTVGYGTQGPSEKQWKHTVKLAEAADILFLVLHARQPGRQTDLEQLQQLDRYFTSHPELLKPPIVAVLSHIDLLSPMMEWSPPYNWQTPTGAKETSIQQAVQAAQEQLGKLVSAVVPVCTSPGKEFGIEQGVLPALAALLSQAKGVALLRVLHREGSEHQVQKVFTQLLSIGKTLTNVFLNTKKAQ